MQEIKDVVSGHALLSSKLQQLAQCLAEGSVPLSWDKDWEGPEQVQPHLPAELRELRGGRDGVSGWVSERVCVCVRARAGE